MRYLEWQWLTSNGHRPQHDFIPSELVGCERHIVNIVATTITKLSCADEAANGDLRGRKRVPKAKGRAPKNRSFTVQTLRFLSRCFRAHDKDVWQAFAAEWGDFGEVAVSAGCRHLSEYEVAKWLLPRLDMLKDFAAKHKEQFKVATGKGKKLGQALGEILEHWDFFVWDVRVMSYVYERWLFPLFVSADKNTTEVHLAYVQQMDRKLETEMGDAAAMKTAFTETMEELDRQAAEQQEYWKIAAERFENATKELCNPAQRDAAWAQARRIVANDPPGPQDDWPTGIVTRRKHQRLYISYEATRLKFKEFSASLTGVTVNSFVSQIQRHNYGAENAMKHFRDALLKSPTKRIELCEVYTWVKLDRFCKGLKGSLRAGWGCPGITEPAVQPTDRLHLSTRARNVQVKLWKRRAQKRKQRRQYAKKVEAELVAAIAKATATSRRRIVRKVRRWAGVSVFKAGPWIGRGADRRRLAVPEVPTYNMHMAITKAGGWTGAFCENFCRLINLLPPEESPFPQCAKDLVAIGVYNGLSAAQHRSLIANRLLPIGAANTAGTRQGTVPDVKRSHAVKLGVCHDIMRVCAKHQWPRAQPRARRPTRFHDDDSDSDEEGSGGAEVWLRVDLGSDEESDDDSSSAAVANSTSSATAAAAAASSGDQRDDGTSSSDDEDNGADGDGGSGDESGIDSDSSGSDSDSDSDSDADL